MFYVWNMFSKYNYKDIPKYFVKRKIDTLEIILVKISLQKIVIKTLQKKVDIQKERDRGCVVGAWMLLSSVILLMGVLDYREGGWISNREIQSFLTK